MPSSPQQKNPRFPSWIIRTFLILGPCIATFIFADSLVTLVGLEAQNNFTLALRALAASVFTAVLADLVQTNRLVRALESQLQDSIQPIHFTAANGISHVFSTRAKAMEVIDDLMNSQDVHRLWAYGISLKEDFAIESKLPQLDRLAKMEENSLRILLTDPYCSPSVFLALLSHPHSQLNQWETALDEQDAAAISATLSSSHLWADLDSLTKQICAKESLRRNVRFSSHLPSSWIVIVGDEIFYQPLMLTTPSLTGDSSNVTGVPTQASGPVFQIQKGSKFAAVVEGHLDTLWDTSDNDVLKTLRKGASADALERICSERSSWLKNVVLFRQGEANFRRSVWRHECDKDDGQEQKVSIEIAGVEHFGTAKNYSFDGLCVRFPGTYEPIKPCAEVGADAFVKYPNPIIEGPFMNAVPHGQLKVAGISEGKGREAGKLLLHLGKELQTAS